MYVDANEPFQWLRTCFSGAHVARRDVAKCKVTYHLVHGCICASLDDFTYI